MNRVRQLPCNYRALEWTLGDTIKTGPLPSGTSSIPVVAQDYRLLIIRWESLDMINIARVG